MEKEKSKADPEHIEEKDSSNLALDLERLSLKPNPPPPKPPISPIITKAKKLVEQALVNTSSRELSSDANEGITETSFKLMWMTAILSLDPNAEIHSEYETNTGRIDLLVRTSNHDDDEDTLILLELKYIRCGYLSSAHCPWSHWKEQQKAWQRAADAIKTIKPKSEIIRKVHYVHYHDSYEDFLAYANFQKAIEYTITKKGKIKATYPVSVKCDEASEQLNRYVIDIEDIDAFQGLPRIKHIILGVAQSVLIASF